MFVSRVFCVAVLAGSLVSITPAADVPVTDSVAAGHSYHGEAFNEGPRQAAVMMPGMAKIEFPTSTKNDAAQGFIEQGIAQLHGFWYLEAERSFRQAAKEDPELAIAYWGMAMANVNNDDRARGFIDEAKAKSAKNTSKREKLYIDALDRFLPKQDKGDDKKESEPAKDQKDREKDEKKKRGERYVADLEKILHEYPDDIEAKAFLVVQLWMGDRYGVKLTSRYAVEALLGEIFAANPAHPAHHYRIHLWDSARPANALVSAAECGPAGPGIAHMWHMPGHIYSKLKRYSDAAWQQEASARVDHSHMIRTRLMPDQIHNFAHNNEWLVRNLIHIGRVNDAVDLARNLVSLPQHPNYNSLEKRGSHKYGRQRLVQTLTRFGLWQELIDEMQGQYLPPTDHEQTRRDELGWLGVAQFMAGHKTDGAKTLRRLQRERIELQTRLLDVADQDTSEKDATKDEDSKELKKELESLRAVIARVAAAAAAKRKDLATLNKHLKAAKLDATMEAQWLGLAGDRSAGIKAAERAVKSGPSEVLPLAVLVDLLWKDDKQDEAKKQFETLRTVAAEADLDTPILAGLSELAKSAGAEGDWREKSEPESDLGARPPLDDLGPFRWQPYMAESWQAKTPEGDVVTDIELGNRPKILIFYLGFGCLHCVDQLHAFAPHVEDFRKAGIDLVGISTETTDDLMTGIKAFDKKLEMPLYSDGEQHVFKTFRCWDDFEDQPLHGTFLIDATGRVRWQDISYEPFMDAEFLLKESKRLLELP
ncbi:AhpC/TSA family protein [Stieleria neptunia]|uniref:AhpC/TSA family protein n=1 Tax=Stieleria neptunia TaxID=2527979 RepID=A0A518HZE1_9BACT|nr:redoxin domain-containing protein [Stieleria neptunia]QDV46209.1 AhpC/TSA family protein [Stieleria neptunia]